MRSSVPRCCVPLALFVLSAFGCSGDGGAADASGVASGDDTISADASALPTDTATSFTDTGVASPDTSTLPLPDTTVPDTYVTPPDTYVTPPDTYVAPPDTYVAPPDTYVAPDTPQVNPGCSRTGFETARDQATTEAFGIQYAALSESGTPYDVILVQIYNDFDGPRSPGTYSLDGINYADCGLCVLAFSNCNGTNCEKTWYADEGSVDITAVGGLGSQFAASLHDVVFDEVTINDQTFVSTPVPGGETWCVDGLSYDESIADGSGANCDDPNVVCVGETVTDFSLQNCETEEMVSWQSLLTRGKKAMWLVLTAGWCPACHEWVPQVLSTYAESARRGLQLMVILGENESGGQPNPAYCRSYAAQYDDDASMFYIDHDGEYSYATTFLHLWPYLDENGAFGLPWNALIDATTFEYVYGDGGGGSLETSLNSLLAK